MSTTLGEDERAFLQQRVAGFGLLAASCYLLFFGYRLAKGELRTLQEDPTLWYHLLSAAAFLTVWLVCRRGGHAAWLVRLVEAGGLLMGAAAMAVMVQYTHHYERPDHVLLLSLSIAFMARTLYVPSSARRTLLLALMVGAEVCAGVHQAYQDFVPENWHAIAPDLAQLTSGEVASAVTVGAASWWALTTVLATSASRLIYGLRRQVRDALQLGQYRLGEKLGEGGMGAVYRGSHALLRRPTAIKMLLPKRNASVDLRRFEQEVQHTARLSHPNIVTIFDYGHTPDRVFYYAMEFIDGLSLANLVERHGPQPPARVRLLLIQIASALVHAHGDGLIHRDIKPANIMLFLPHRHGGQAEQVKLVDFGLVKDLRDEDAANVTQANALVGTPQYMAPEVIRTPNSADARSDLYAVGAVAYFLLSGRHVFDGRTFLEVCGQHLHAAPEPLSSTCPSVVSEALERCVMDCLAKSPEERPASALALLNALMAVPDSGGWNAETTQAWWNEHAAGSAVSNGDEPAEALTMMTVDVRAL